MRDKQSRRAQKIGIIRQDKSKKKRSFDQLKKPTETLAGKSIGGSTSWKTRNCKTRY
jgi:hypothetical protein